MDFQVEAIFNQPGGFVVQGADSRFVGCVAIPSKFDRVLDLLLQLRNVAALKIAH